MITGSSSRERSGMSWKRLTFRKLDHDKLLALDPESCFWAIIPEAPHPSTMERVERAYQGLREKLLEEIEAFRFGIDLTAVYIDPTDRCNAGCPYCYIPEEKRKNGKEMDWPILEKALRRIEDHFSRKEKPPVVIFHASEPLLVKDIIFRAIEEFGHRFKFGLQTNGTLLERSDVNFLIAHRVGVGVSLDSFEPGTNNRLRPERAGREGNFKRAVRAIEWFDGYKGLNVITTITRLNVTQLPEMVEFLHSRRVPCVLLNPVRLTQGYAKEFKPDEEVMTRSFIRAVDRAIELSINSDHRIVIGNFANIVLAIVAPTARRLMCDISPCGAGRCFLTVTAEGEMIPCGEFTGFHGFSGGNVRDSSIREALSSKPFAEVRARMVEKIEECNTCDFRNICGAPCPAEMYGQGNMYKKSVFCNFYKAIIEYAFRLIDEGKAVHLLREGYLRNLKYRYNLSTRKAIQWS